MTLEELITKGFTQKDTIIHLLHCTRVRTLSVQEVQFLESNFLNKPEPKEIKYVDDMDKSCPYTSRCDTYMDKEHLKCKKCPKTY